MTLRRWNQSRRRQSDVASSMTPANDSSWFELLVDEDAAVVRKAATCLSAMGYEVHIQDRHGCPASMDSSDDQTPTLTMLVPMDVAPELVDVIDELLKEQQDFDQRVQSHRWRECLSGRVTFAIVLMVLLVLLIAQIR